MIEVTALVLTGRIPLIDGVFRLTLPMFAGNVVGGTSHFKVLAYAQVREEV